MALTAEQQAEIQLEIDKQVFRLNAEAAAGISAREQARDAAHEAARLVERRMEAVRLARDILMENNRNKPTGERGITAADVTTFADAIVNYIQN